MTGGRHSARATRALQRLGEADPALGSLALWCRHRDGEGEPAPAWTDGVTIHYGPGFAALPEHEQVGLAAHHVMHVAFRHVPRARALRLRFGGGFEGALYNLAADALVNQTLVLAGHALPRPAVLLDDLLAEALDEAPAPVPAIGRYDAETLYLRLVAADGGRRGDRRTGRDGPADGPAAGERAQDYARASDFAEDLRAAGTAADDRAEDGRDEAEWRQRLARALEAGRSAGRGLGALGHRLADLPEVRTPWETILRGLVTRAVTPAPRVSPVRPARRWIARDAAARRVGADGPAFEPAVLRDRQVPRIAVAIDASGSIETRVLALFAAQVAGIGRRTGAEVHVLVFDTEVRSRTRMQGMRWEREIVGIDFARGGGTAFVDVIAAAATLAPSIIVVLTDLDGPVGPAPGRIPVIWAVPGPPPPAPPPFGRVLSLAR